MTNDERELFIPKATDPSATWGEFPAEDERLLVSLEVMALLQSDFPEAAGLFQADPAALWAAEMASAPTRWLLGFDGSHDGGVSAFQVDPRLWAITDRFEAGTALNEGDIRADERKLVCAEEGHRELDRTTLGSLVLQIQCGRCGKSWETARDPYDTPVAEALALERHYGIPFPQIAASVLGHGEVERTRKGARFFARTLLRTLQEIRNERST